MACTYKVDGPMELGLDPWFDFPILWLKMQHPGIPTADYWQQLNPDPLIDHGIG